MAQKGQRGARKVAPLHAQKEPNPQSPIELGSNRTAAGSYRQDWTLYNRGQTNELEHFTRMLWHLCELQEGPQQERGQPRIDFHAILFLLVYSCYYSQLSKRRLVAQLRVTKDILKLPRVPHFNTLYNYMKNPVMTSYLRRMLVISSLPLVGMETHFAADATGFTTSNRKEWKKVKYGNSEKWNEFVKLHVMCGVRTRIITAVEVTPEYTHDGPKFESLLKQTQEYFVVEAVSADKAYSSYKNVELVVSSNALSLIRFRDNARAEGRPPAWKKAFHYFRLHEEDFLAGYHLRSNVETLFGAMKLKFGDHLRSKSFQGQMNELLCIAICHNLCVLVHSMLEFQIEPTDLFPNI